jgi:hypothetical protein
MRRTSSGVKLRAGAVSFPGASLEAGTDTFSGSTIGVATALVSGSLGELSVSAQPETVKIHPAISKFDLFTNALSSLKNRTFISKPNAVPQMDQIRLNTSNCIVARPIISQCQVQTCSVKLGIIWLLMYTLWCGWEACGQIRRLIDRTPAAKQIRRWRLITQSHALKKRYRACTHIQPGKLLET